MHLRTRKLTSSACLLLLAAAAFSACGSDSKKKAPGAQGGDAGAAGASTGEAGAETNAGGGDVVGPGAGAGGEAVVPVAGAGQGGASGGGVETLAPFGIMFSVAPGAQGVPATGVADSAPQAASNLYDSTGSGATHVEGTNALGYTAADLGIDPDDDLDAVSIIHPVSASAFYFSVVDTAAHEEGVDGTGVRRSSTDGEVQSDIFMTYALAPLSGNGSNIEWIDEYRLGLNPETQGAPAPDNLNALDIGVPPGTDLVFFSVSPDSAGAAGSAVATLAGSVDAAELGCTIFSSDLAGTNAVAFSCADLGLVAGDDVDALVVLGAGDQPQTVLFSVTPGSVGAAATGVATQAGQAAADVFASDGTGDNTVYIEERALGLLADDDLDALAVETATDPGGTWLPPPPEDPPPPPEDPPHCPWEITGVHTNPGAGDPVPHSLPAMGSRVATPSGRIVRYSSMVRQFSQADADRANALQACGTRRTESLLTTRMFVTCPNGVAQFTPGYYLIAVIETEEPLDFDAWQQLQVALIIDSNGDLTDNYVALPPYTNDTFDATDEALQITRSGALIVRAQDISDNTFQDLTGRANRVVVQGNRIILIMQVDDALPYLHRLTVYAANGQDWSMSNVNPVSEPLVAAEVSSCP